MQREIKFRGLRTDGKGWVYGQYGYNTDFKLSIINYNDGDYRCTHIVNPESVGQYTGLKDKNGVDIYEGDVVKTGTDKVMVITWNNRFASFCIERDGWAFSHWFGEAFESIDCEIVGNIHQNPELI